MAASKDNRPLNLQLICDSSDEQQRIGRAFEMRNLWNVEQRMRELHSQLAAEARRGDGRFDAIKRTTCQWLADLENQDLDANAAYRTARSLGLRSLSDMLAQVGSWSDGLECNVGKPLEELHLTDEFAQMHRNVATETARSSGITSGASVSSASSSASAHLAPGPYDTTYRAHTNRTNSVQFTPPSSSRRT